MIAPVFLVYLIADIAVVIGMIVMPDSEADFPNGNILRLKDDIPPIKGETAAFASYVSISRSSIRSPDMLKKSLLNMLSLIHITSFTVLVRRSYREKSPILPSSSPML